jgi:hypothetical protein
MLKILIDAEEKNRSQKVWFLSYYAVLFAAVITHDLILHKKLEGFELFSLNHIEECC